jgi:hypothetical protein
VAAVAAAELEILLLLEALVERPHSLEQQAQLGVMVALQVIEIHQILVQVVLQIVAAVQMAHTVLKAVAAF